MVSMEDRIEKMSGDWPYDGPRNCSWCGHKSHQCTCTPEEKAQRGEEE